MLRGLRQLPGDRLVEDLADGEGDDGLAALAEEGVDLAQGVGGVAGAGNTPKRRRAAPSLSG